MAQRYSGEIQLDRMSRGRCPECGYLPEEHTGLGNGWCSLRDDGVDARIDQYRRDRSEATA